jgi:hypothetical protein
MNLDDLIGIKFNMLEVVSYSHSKNKGGKQRGVYHYYNCKCECGNNTIATREQIHQKLKMSCGCKKREETIAFNKTKKRYNTYDLSGEYGIGYTFKNEEFYFDLEDFDLIKDYCWHMGNRGYIMCTIPSIKTTENPKTKYDLLFHRLVMNCEKQNVDVDHINGINTRNDNRKYNLRVCQHHENMRNRARCSNNKSGVMGVSFDNTHKKWKSRITCEKIIYNLGSFENKDDAIIARLKAEKELFGEFSGQQHLYKQYNI